MLTSSEIFEILAKHQALIKNSHIVYTSGKHGSAYVNKDAIYPHTELTSTLCKEIALHFQNEKVDAVLAPAVGGVILSQWVAHHLSVLKKQEILGIYGEKDGDSFIIKRGYDLLVKNRRVLIVEDILTTGGSVKKLVEVARKIPCEVIGVAALCNRGNVTTEMLGGVPALHSLTEISLDSWDSDACPLCKQGVPINTTVGKGKKQH